MHLLVGQLEAKMPPKLLLLNVNIPQSSVL